MALGARYLAALWEGAWLEGRAAGIPASKLKTQNRSKVRNRYIDEEFVRSVLQDDFPDRGQAKFADEKEALRAAQKSLAYPTTVQKVGDIGRVANIYRLGDEKAPEWLARNRTTFLKAINGASYDSWIRSFQSPCRKMPGRSLLVFEYFTKAYCVARA